MITVIGSGTGGGPGAHAEELARATLVLGARRHLAAAPLSPGARRVELGPLAPALDDVAAHLAAAGPGFTPRVVVLASGDPGFFGIVRALGERFGPSALRVEPSVPSVALAFARTGLTWDDAAVVSGHGRDPRTAFNVCRAHPKTAVLTGPGCGPAELGAALVRTGTPRTLVVAGALGTPQERVERLSPAEAAARCWADGPVSVVLCLDPSRTVPAAQRALAGPCPAAARAGGADRASGADRAGPAAQWALPEGAFAHRDSMVTKFEVRALALARMGPGPGDLVWDVGAGSGSVAVECARLGAAAIAVEKDADGVARVRANAAAHGVDVTAVHGTAPGALDRLPCPDAVFVGGGGSRLPEIVAACARRARRAVVVTLAALDRVPAVRTALADAGLAADGVLLNSARLAPLPGDVTRLAAANPVFVLWGLAPRAAEGPGPAEGTGLPGRAAHLAGAEDPERPASPERPEPSGRPGSPESAESPVRPPSSEGAAS